MIYGERTKRELHEDDKGVTGTIVILCDWSDVDPAPILELPHRGNSWPGLPYLKCVKIDMIEGQAGECEYTAQYSTERQLGEEFYETSLDFGTEVIDCTKGYIWETTGTPVTIDIPSEESVTIYTIKMRAAITDYAAISNNVGSINSKVFHGFDVGLLRFNGATTDESYDANGNLLSVYSVYKFTKRERNHNYFWREPLQARDIDTNPLFWQNLDATQPFYTIDTSKAATPVWINEVPGQETNLAGIGDWDKPKNGSDYRYKSCDFATVLGLPTKAGDG